jgi:ankyrin repeat protein
MQEVEEMNEAAKMRAGLIPYKQVASLEDHLVTAAEKGDVEAIRRLVAEGANVNATDCLQKTPMHFAAVHGQTEALRALKELGGDPNMKAMGGKRPLDWARVTNRGTPRKDAEGSLALLESWAAEDAAKAAAAAS